MTHQRYPLLADFFASWLHQDFDLGGPELRDVLAEYQRVTPRSKQALLRTEVDHFHADHPYDTEQAIERIFSPEVSVTALSGSAAAFLQEIQRVLAEE
jgi:hypothetical protein